MRRYLQVCKALRARPKRWLVTGAAGCVGSATAERLLQLGQTVVGVDDFSTGQLANLEEVFRRAPCEAAGNFHFFRGELADLETCRRLCAEVSLVVHLAGPAQRPSGATPEPPGPRTGTAAFLNLLLAARDSLNVRRVVFAAGGPCDVHAAAVQDGFGLETVGLRYRGLFGPRQQPSSPHATVIPAWLERLSRGQACTMPGDGSARIDVCYVGDAVQANLLAATEPNVRATKRVYDVASALGVSYHDLFWELARLLAERGALVAPRPPTHSECEPEADTGALAEIDDLCAFLQFLPAYQLTAALAETVDWHLRRPAAVAASVR